MRAVARAAGCDAALVHHYFSSKEQLFFDALRVAVNAEEAIRYLIEPGAPGLGRRLFTFLTGVYDSPHGAELVSVLTRDIETRTVFVDMIGERIEQVATQLLPLGRSQRARLSAQVEAVLAGFVTTRYLLKTKQASALTRSEAITVKVIVAELSAKSPASNGECAATSSLVTRCQIGRMTLRPVSTFLVKRASSSACVHCFAKKLGERITTPNLAPAMPFSISCRMP